MSQNTQEIPHSFIDDKSYKDFIDKCKKDEIDFSSLTGGLTLDEFEKIAKHFKKPYIKTYSLNRDAALLSYIIKQQKKLSEEEFGRKFSTPEKEPKDKRFYAKRGESAKKKYEIACATLMKNSDLSEDLKTKLKKALCYPVSVEAKSEGKSIENSSSETVVDPFTPKSSSSSLELQPPFTTNSSQYPDNTPLLPRKLDVTSEDSAQKHTHIGTTAPSAIRPNSTVVNPSSFKPTITLNANLASGFYGVTRAVLDTPQLDANARQIYLVNALSFFRDNAKMGKNVVEDEKFTEQLNKKDDTYSKADGNCAYNAFAIALGTLVTDLADKLPGSIKHKLMIFFSLYDDQCNTFSDVVKYFKEHTSSEWQKDLSNKLRKIAVFILSSDERHMLDYYDLLYDVFIEVIDPKDDDNFLVHNFIKAQFKAIKNLPNEGKLLSDWWSNEGWQMYLNEIRKPAKSTFDRARWGGSQELSILAEYFTLGIDINRCGAQTESLQSHFLLPRKLYSNQQLQKLEERGVVERKNGRYYLCWTMKESKHIEEASAELLRLKETIEALRASFLEQYNNEWILSDDSVQGLGADIYQLCQRNVVSKIGKGSINYKLIKDVVNDDEVLTARLEKIDVKDLLSILDKNAKILIKLKFNGGHWDFVSYESRGPSHTNPEEPKLVTQSSTQQDLNSKKNGDVMDPQTDEETKEDLGDHRVSSVVQ